MDRGTFHRPSSIQPGLGHLQEWGVHNLSGQISQESYHKDIPKPQDKTTDCRAGCGTGTCPSRKAQGFKVSQALLVNKRRGESNPEGWSFPMTEVSSDRHLSGVLLPWLIGTFQLWNGDESGCLQRPATVIPKQFPVAENLGCIISAGRVCGVSSPSRMLLDMPSLIHQKDDPPHPTHPRLIHA